MNYLATLGPGPIKTRNTLMKIYKTEFEATMSPKWKKWHMIFSEKKYDAWKALGAV